MGRPNFGWDHEKFRWYQERLQKAIDEAASGLKDEYGTVLEPKRTTTQPSLPPERWPSMEHVKLKGKVEHMVPYRNRLIVFTDISVAAVTVDELLGRHVKKAK